MLVCYLLSVGLKQAGCVGFVFPREFSSLSRVSRGRFVLLRRNLCCVTSPGKLSALQSLNSLLRDFAALARS